MANDGGAGPRAVSWRGAAPLPRAAARGYLRHLDLLRSLPDEGGIAPVQDGGVDPDGHPWLRFPDHPTTVADLLRSGALSAPTAGVAVGAAARALTTLHGVGLVAGVVSPARLLSDPTGVVRLAPPPPVHLVEPDPAYSAPEVLLGEDPTEASDRYALAATAYALLAGEPPFGTGQPAALRALTTAPPRLHRPDVPPEVTDVLVRGLARDPACRPTVEEIGDRVAGTGPPRSRPTPPGGVDTKESSTAGAQPSVGTPVVDPRELATLHPDPTGAPLGSNYRYDEEIGSGASGVVWRGRRISDGQPVAIKILRRELVGHPDALVRFLRQRTVLPALMHPHLVRVHDLVAEGDVVAIVMDLVTGEHLRQAAAYAGLTRSETLTVLAQVAGALAAVHAVGVVHRDVKPENVVLRHDGDRLHAYLTDLGLAKLLDGPQLTSESVVVGTPSYLAPEIHTGHPALPASDVYALGVTLYELLAGQRPIRGSGAAALQLAHLEQEPARPAGLPDPLWDLLRACLAKDPAARPAAATVADRLTCLAAGDAAAGRPGGGATLPPAVAPVPAAGDRSPADGGPSGDGRSGAGGGVAGSSGYGTGARDAAGTGEATRSTVRPLADPSTPTPPARRRRWIPLTVAAVVCALVAGGVGLALGDRGGPPSTPTPTATEQAQPVLYRLPVTATSARAGTVRLTFPDGTALPGFQYYLVYRDGTPIEDFTPDASPFLVATADHRTRHCYEIAALLDTAEPPPPLKTTPACQAANGRPDQ
ncbi:serine/threonine protein kinase [Micromonospora matsumotoense]|uniref:non-specific serine/threonine protein kinase n=1 Tax=Micromonospora matsumotoense TaxID=121616 RepID=A0A1C5A9U2_9ACTN|nr:serine/threonine-protein kinase [Micromonospora matsumotoense]SCF42013.1 serine/threonine protein kinase [Micromonospora matsumotoense]